MAYLYSTGSRGLGDIEFEGDPDETQIDFEDDFIALKTGGNQTLVVSGTAVGIGTSAPDYNLHVASTGASVVLIDGAAGADAFLRFGQNGTLKSYIKQGSGGNLVITNQTSDRDIIFNIKDDTTEREGLRLNGDVAEVVINEGSDSLVDFRVESDSNTHMLFVDGSSNNVGIGTSTPDSDLHVNGTTHTDGGVKWKLTDASADITLTTDHHVIRCVQTAPISVHLPSKTAAANHVFIIKDALGIAGTYVIKVKQNGLDTIDGSTSRYDIGVNYGSLTIMCDGVNGWMII
jgi:hypothetical protein